MYVVCWQAIKMLCLALYLSQMKAFLCWLAMFYLWSTITKWLDNYIILSGNMQETDG